MHAGPIKLALLRNFFSSCSFVRRPTDTDALAKATLRIGRMWIKLDLNERSGEQFEDSDILLKMDLI